MSRIYLGVTGAIDCIPRDASKNVGAVPLGLAIRQEAHAFFNKPPSLLCSV